MRSFLVSQHLLVILSVISLTRAQTTPAPTTTIETPTTLPETSAVILEPTTTPELPTTTAETTTETTIETSTVTSETTTPELTTAAETTTETTTETATETTAKTTTVPTSIAETTPWTAPAIFYPFGAVEGDTEIIEAGYETYEHVNFSTPFTYFGRKYNSTYLNNNGLITFNHPLPEAHPYQFPTNGIEDYIAPLWTELDDVGIGVYSYQQYTSGSVLTRATQDINQYFPGRGFTASWVFVVTWDYVLTYNMDEFNRREGPRITFQAVLILGDGFSFILMHYGDCAGEQFPVGAGYDTIGSTDYYQIYYNPYDGNSIPMLKTTTNVDVPGRWAFLVNNGTETVIGVQMKLKSFSDLLQDKNIEVVLHQIKQELIKYGVSSNFELKFRKVKKTQ